MTTASEAVRQGRNYIEANEANASCWIFKIKKDWKKKIVFISNCFTESVVQEASSLHSLMLPLHFFRDPCFYFTFGFRSWWSIVCTSVSRVSRSFFLLFSYFMTIVWVLIFISKRAQCCMSTNVQILCGKIF